MNDFITLQCPHCWERFQHALDAGEGRAEFIVDCEVCCRPMTVAVRVRYGAIEELRVAPC